jgi:hypothetical protein
MEACRAKSEIGHLDRLISCDGLAVHGDGALMCHE